jgi:magnesium transporter
MRTDVASARADGPTEDAAKKLAEYDLLALPVVDEEGRLVGIITHDDAFDIAEEEATQDIQMLGAVAPLEEGYLDTSAFKLWRKLIVWLSLLFVAEMLTSLVLVSYEKRLEASIALAFFLPLVISTGGNSGAQTSTLLTRAVSLGEVASGQWLHVLRRELLIGLCLGAALGAIALVRVYALPMGHAKEEVASVGRLALSVSLAVAAICLWGSLIGAMLPLAFRRVGLDPAVASGPFVATFVDVTGIMIYLSIADTVMP